MSNPGAHGAGLISPFGVRALPTAVLRGLCWRPAVGLLTCQSAFVESLQHHSQSEKGKGHVEIPVLRQPHSHVVTVHLGILLCCGDSQVPQIACPQAWKMQRGNSEAADGEGLRGF